MFKALRMLTLLGAILATAAYGATTTYVAPQGLTGSQESPPTGSPATGTGMAIFDSVALTLTVDLTWQGLIAPAAAAHIHCCTSPGVPNATVAIDFVPAGFPNAVFGDFSHVFDLDDAASYGGGFLTNFGGDVDAARAAFITGINAGQAYFNIHSPPPLGFPSGEIRGNIEVVPEPGAVVLVGFGLAAVFISRRNFA